jgi:capsule polysaccharide export protein KpsC/LpsZ
LVYVAWDSSTCVRAMVQRYAESIGLKYFWVNNDSNFHRTGEYIKQATMVAIWNGNQFSSPLAAKICQQRNIPHFFIENGMLPQRPNITIDLKGFCGDSMLNGDLSWVTESDMENLFARREELQKRYPIRDEGFVLVPLQIHNDAQVLYHSSFNSMRDLIVHVRSLYPNHKIISRPHPRGGNRYQHFEDVENITHLTQREVLWSQDLRFDSL